MKASLNRDNKGMTLLEVIVSFAIIAIVVLFFVVSFTTVGTINARTNVLQDNDTSLTLDIETEENLKESGPPVSKSVTSSGGYQMDISITTYTTEDGLDSIRTFSYEP